VVRIDAAHHRVALALDQHDRHAGKLHLAVGKLAHRLLVMHAGALLHGLESAHGRVAGAEDRRRMQAGGGNQLRMAQGQNGRQTSPGGQARDIGSSRIQLMPGAHLLDHFDNQRDIAIALLGGAPVPVPAAVRIGGNRLLRIQHRETLALGQLVHAGGSGKIGSGLLAAVQHDDQRERPLRNARRQVKPVHHPARRRQPRTLQAEK